MLLRIAEVFGVTAEYFVNDELNKPTTLAAHFDGTEYTQEQLDRIKEFAKFIKQESK